MTYILSWNTGSYLEGKEILLIRNPQFIIVFIKFRCCIPPSHSLIQHTIIYNFKDYHLIGYDAAARSSKKVIHFYQTRRLHVPEGRNLQRQRHENFKPQMYPFISKIAYPTEVFQQYVACISSKHAPILISPLMHLSVLQGNRTQCPYKCSTCIARVIQNKQASV
jgi:hypothetical protein